MRTCVGCRQRRPATELVRVVRSADGELAMGRTLPGRGAWLCSVPGPCLDLAVRRKALERALRAPLAAGAVARLRANVPKRGRIEGRDVILNVAATGAATDRGGTHEANDETERGQS